MVTKASFCWRDEARKQARNHLNLLQRLQRSGAPPPLTTRISRWQREHVLKYPTASGKCPSPQIALVGAREAEETAEAEDRWACVASTHRPARATCRRPGEMGGATPINESRARSGIVLYSTAVRQQPQQQLRSCRAALQLLALRFGLLLAGCSTAAMAECMC